MKLNKPLATPIQRYEMCSIALKYFSKLELVDFEIHSSSPSYTYDTINFLDQNHLSQNRHNRCRNGLPSKKLIYGKRK